MNPSPEQDTIVAVATPPGLGGVAIVRVSGPEAERIAQALFFDPSGRCFAEWPTHLLRYGRLIDPRTRETIDRAMAVFMAGPRTFTGEDVVEFHLHGSPLLCELTIRLCSEAGARLARPGEFTQRAFLQGKLDLTQAEAVLDLIESRTRAQARLASQHLEGRFSQRVDAVREEVLHWLALLEADIDFGDEIDDLPETQQRQTLESLQTAVEELLSDAQQGRVSIQGLRTVLVGAPNAGKSSLLNALLGEDRALVTPIAGTTRDRIEVDCQLDGVLLNLIDTAGLRSQTDDQVELLGMEKTREALSMADFQVLLVDSADPDLSFCQRAEISPGLILLNKTDLERKVDLAELERCFPSVPRFECELLSPEGRDKAVRHLTSVARQLADSQVGECFSLNQRHRESLVRTRECLEAVSQTLDQGLGAEFLALDLRRAATALGEILGLEITEEILDRIFGQFCLGK